MNTDAEIWKEHAEKADMEGLKGLLDNPPVYAKELKELFDNLPFNTNNPSVIETGSSFGINTAILSDKFKKTILDYDETTINKSKQFYSQQNIPIDCVLMDIFNLEKESKNKYDLVYNAGVLEHFTLSERKDIIRNMYEITNPGGYIALAVPNHYSVPYRVGYLSLSLRNKWVYPQEFKIKNFIPETKNLDVNLYDVSSLDYDTIYKFIPTKSIKLFKVIDKINKFEGYLKVFIYKKTK